MCNLEFEFYPSRYYLIFLLILMIASLNIIRSLALACVFKIGLVFLLLIYLGHLGWHYGLLRSQNAIIRIRQASNGQWLLQARGKVYEGKLHGSSTVTRLVSVLRFSIPHHFWLKSVVVFCDSLEKDVYRQLRVAVRMH